ncbi:hypothetical protein L4D20_03825 [Vibrio kyushuensis]|uniref:hypothetical protein n=1 Tax=Vibrio kyushuensis TaxID=2910249 RepID=UPI003D0B25F5
MSNKKRANKAILKRYEESIDPIRQLHVQLFPEEYDFHYDSNVEIRQRNKGINPMSEDYQKEVNIHRLSMGVEPYMGSVGVSSVKGLISSHQYCQNKLQESVEN